MTQPPSGRPGEQPQDPQPGGWPPPPAPGGWAPPPAPGGWAPPPPPPSGSPGAWPPPQQPAAPPAGWGPPPQQPGPPPGAWGQPQQPHEPVWVPTPPPKSRSRGKLIASTAVVAALVAGGAVTYVALSDSNSNGAGSPKQAVQSIVTDLNKADLVGVLDDLAPGERSSLANPTLDEINHLKRLKVLQQSADPKNVSGVSFKAENLTFTDKTVPINDHVQIVQLTGGTLDVGGDASKVPFTKQFLAAAFPHGLPAQSNGSTHIDIAKQIRTNGGGPVRIATQKVGGKWYPSIFYTVADAAANKVAPAAADAIPAVGASSPHEAVSRMIDALLHDDLTGAIKLLSPDELAVMHDYGGLFLRKAGSYDRPDFTIDDLKTTTQSVSGGATRVLLSSITVTTGSGEHSTVTVDGSCVQVTVNGDSKRMCTTDFVTQIIDTLHNFGVTADVSPAQRQALSDLLGGVTKIGVDTTQSGGSWYVNPVRSYLDITTSVLSGLKGNDLIELINLFSSAGH